MIEDRFAGPRPRWELGGAQVVGNVRAFEVAKLRMLNGAHSALAYLGIARGHEFVHEAITDPGIRPLIVCLMRDEAGPTVPAGVDIDTYTDTLLMRFGNTGLPHRLRQIGMDGSQKIPQRWLHTLAEQQRRGRDCPAIIEALAAWLTHVRGDHGPVDDPRADELAGLWRDAGQEGIVDRLFGVNGAFAAHWSADPEAATALASRLRKSEG